MKRCKPTAPCLVVELSHQGSAQVQVCESTLSTGLAGLVLADLAATYVRDNPPTAEDRAAWDRMERARR